MKIVFLGNSLVEGVYGGNFVTEIAAQLPQHRIINAGQSGNTILNLQRRLDSVLEQEPDGVFVLAGGNDAISYAQPTTRRYYEQGQGVPGGFVSPDDFAQAYRDLLTQIKLAHAQAWIALGPMEHNREAQQTVQQYNQLAREAAEPLNIPVLDLMAELAPKELPERPALSLSDINLIGQRMRSGWKDYEAEQKRGGYTYSFDGIHFTPETARRAANIIIDFMGLQT